MKGCSSGWNMIDWPFSAIALSRAVNAKIKTRDKYFNNSGAQFKLNSACTCVMPQRRESRWLLV